MNIQSKTSTIIQCICCIILIVSFFLSWIDMGIISFTGIKIPHLNEILTKTSNVFYVFTPSKKSSTQIGYVLYLIPILSFISLILLFSLRKSVVSKYILLLTCILGAIFAIYVDVRIMASLKFSNIGVGSHLLLLTCITYILLFFSSLMRRKIRI